MAKGPFMTSLLLWFKALVDIRIIIEISNVDNWRGDGDTRRGWRFEGLKELSAGADQRSPSGSGLINCSVPKKKKKKGGKRKRAGCERNSKAASAPLPPPSHGSTLSSVITLGLARGNRPWGSSETPLVYPIHLCPPLEARCH